MKSKLEFSLVAAAILVLIAVFSTQMTIATPDQESLAALDVLSESSATLVVNSTSDSGPGTLRQALLDAQSGDTITFDPTVFPPSAPATILLSAQDDDSALPNVSQGDLTIDASNAGVILDGSGIQGDWVNGLEIYSDGNTVRGLQILNFSGSGIALCGGSYNTIGGDRNIGIGPLGQANLAGKNGIGIDLCGQGSFNTITGNIVGTDPSNTRDWGNEIDGVLVENGMTKNAIGPYNIVAHSDRNGIQIMGSNAFGNVITQNSIHDNDLLGIRLWDGGNAMLNAPQITDFDVAMGTVTGTACSGCTVEIFSDNSDEGAVCEGQTKADSAGAFSFSKGDSFTGPHLAATATDADGNTSEFSFATYRLLQQENDHAIVRFRHRKSAEIPDNHIGRHWHSLALAPDLSEMLSDTLDVGLKRFRLAINSIDSDKIIWDLSESSIDPIYDEFISRLADNDITITYVLSFWDKAHVAAGGAINTPRFKTEEEIQRYLDFVRFIVRHFRDRVQYYEIWNEPNISDMELQWIEVEDYINLVRRTVPVIRQEYPAARIVVGSTSELRDPGSRDYLFSILNSGIISQVDAIAWHPFYGESPAYDDLRSYYYGYPSIVEEIKYAASAKGFAGEYIGDEVAWRTHDDPDPDHPWTYSRSVAAKYYARGIMTHLGIGARVSQHAVDTEDPVIRPAVQNLCTVMAGAKSLSLPIQIQTTVTNTVSYTFSLPSGAHLIALWTDGVAVDNDPGVPSTLTVPGLAEHTAIGIDVLHGLQQELVTSEESSNLVIRDLLVKDYPLILWVYEPKYVFLPSILKGAVVDEENK